MDDDHTLRVDAPSGSFSAIMVFWAMPAILSDSVKTSIPIVPAWLHEVIVKGLESTIWRTIYGPTDDRYITAEKEYQEGIELANIKKDFSTKFSREMIVSAGEAIQSTV